MKKLIRTARVLFALGSLTALFLGFFPLDTKASPPWLGGRGWAFWGREETEGPNALAGTWYRFPRSRGTNQGCDESGGVGGTWQWMRSPEQEKVVAASLYNRYCIRCHGVDGRGVWDIPGVPDFTNTRWQATRGDDQLARIIIEGRGAVMPTFRGALSLEEAWAVGRYLRTFVPGTEIHRPDLSTPDKGAAPKTK